MIKFLIKRKIYPGIHYRVPNYLHPAFKNKIIYKDLQNSKRIANEIISLPIYPELNISEQNKIIKTIRTFFMSKIIKSINGIKLMKYKIHSDRRGIFYEVYNKKHFNNLKIEDNFVQDNISISKKVLRGMHYTIRNPQSQLLTVLHGKIFDCLVDLRVKSKFFGKYFSLIWTQKI